MVMRLIAGVALIAAAGWVWQPARAEAPAAESHAAAGAHGAGSHEPAEGGKSAEEAGKGLNPITFHGVNFRGDLAIWTAVVFLVVLLILGRFAWGPIAEGLAKREQEILARIDESEKQNQEARQLLDEYQRRLAASQDEVRAILDQARRDAEQAGRDMLDKAKEEAAAERQRAVQQIETAAAAALKDLAERSATLAVELAGKIVRARLSPQDHARLIQEAVTRFTGQANGKK